jgi:hypothetical protein
MEGWRTVAFGAVVACVMQLQRNGASDRRHILVSFYGMTGICRMGQGCD